VKITEERTITKTETVVVDLLCNSCGESLRAKDGCENICGMEEAKVSGNYDSRYLLDTTTYTFSLCEGCIRVMFDAFKIKPDIGSYMGGPYASYDEERASWARHKARWDETEEEREERRKAGMCNDPKCPNMATVRAFQGSHWNLCCNDHTASGYSQQHPIAKETREPTKGDVPIYAVTPGGDLWFVFFDAEKAVSRRYFGNILVMDDTNALFHLPAEMRISGWVIAESEAPLRLEVIDGAIKVFEQKTHAEFAHYQDGTGRDGKQAIYAVVEKA
jgi:hypothetical protein